MKVPTLVHDRLNPPPLPIGCRHQPRPDFTDYHAGYGSVTVMCNVCRARWCVIPPWRLAERRRSLILRRSP